jgi:ankyrin repeat protein
MHLLELLIINYKADVNDRNPENLWTPLHTAAYFNSSETVSSLIKTYGALLDPRSCTNKTPLDLAQLNDSFDSFMILSIMQYRLKQNIYLNLVKATLNEGYRFT